MIRKYPNLSLTLLLFFLLVPPFILRHRYGNLEIYPAILLPSSASKIDIVKNEVNFNEIHVLGKNKFDDSWQKINFKKKISSYSIPTHYLFPIVNNSFGLNHENGKINKLPFGFKVKTNKITEEEVIDTKRWLAENLGSQGDNLEEVKVVFEKVIFDVKVGAVITREITHEEYFELE